MTLARSAWDAAICVASFAAAAVLAQAGGGFGAALILAAAFWWGVEWGAPRTDASPAPRLLAACGAALIAQAGLIYAGSSSLPFGAFLIGCAAASMLTAGARRWLPVDGRAHSKQIVVSETDWRQTRPRFWLDSKLAGLRLETEAMNSQRRLERIAPENVSPEDLLASESLRENRATMAVQAVYSNLIGLALLAISFPLLLAAALAARIAAGAGPFFETVECAGFQGVPFYRRGFRLKDANTGNITGVGKMLSRLRLKGLPQLINLVRGEMSLFGPQPVRSVFTERLESVSPVFARRLSVKPGILGWAQAHGGSRPGARGGINTEIQEEAARIGYDLYYLRFGSPWMDLEIVGRTLLRPWLGKGQ
ncbi:MAG: sugar transferase [Bryobacterales bacterium]|nr:sugar transferase [Bryobacterales bacterium]MBV9399995.1 sugar transferase [Bryobacterales bacterium]